MASKTLQTLTTVCPCSSSPTALYTLWPYASLFLEEMELILPQGVHLLLDSALCWGSLPTDPLFLASSQGTSQINSKLVQHHSTSSQTLIH